MRWAEWLRTFRSSNPEANAAAFAKVLADKEREVRNGHDGTWVAHPDLVPVAMEAFAAMPGDNQLQAAGERARSAGDAGNPLRCTSEAGARENIRVSIQYVSAWLAAAARFRFTI